jgi:L-ascorbate metabolism protein UlaG (beta-lactamase superfamily)
MKKTLSLCLCLLTLACLIPFPGVCGETVPAAGHGLQASDHYDGEFYFNPEPPPVAPLPEQGQRRSRWGWIWRWLIGPDWPQWSGVRDILPGPPPVGRVPEGSLVITPVGHATFLIQMDGLNILTDPIWSERCSPVSWAGPKRHRSPGLRFEELPPIDAVLISHNHYDHLDLSTLKGLADGGAPRAVVPLGNGELMSSAGIPRVDELDWWHSVRLSPQVTVTLVPARHFSSRSLWDRNKTLWGGFVLSGPSGNVFHAGDTGYGAHFREIARRFSPIRAALLPIAPYRPKQSKDALTLHYSLVHMGPAEAIQAHLDLGAQVSLAAHYQVFQLGADGFDDAVTELASLLEERPLKSEAFLMPPLGQAIPLTQSFTDSLVLPPLSPRAANP